MDAAGRVTLENAPTRDLFQRSDRPAPRLAGRLAGTLSRADGSPYELGEVPIARSLRGEEVRGDLVRYAREDGVRFDLRTTSSPLRDASGASVGAIAADEDVTAMSDALARGRPEAPDRRHHDVRDVSRREHHVEPSDVDGNLTPESAGPNGTVFRLRLPTIAQV